METERRRKAGHQEVFGETIANFEFFQHGWNPYSRFLDVDKVDLILRRTVDGVPEYREVQVKSGRLYTADMSKWQQALFDMTSWTTFGDGDFQDAHDALYVAYVVSDIDLDEYRGDIFIFPAREFAAIIAATPLSGGKRHVYMSRCRDNPEQWVVCRQRRKFDSVTGKTCLDVSSYRRNFGALDLT
jgi:hypothetical protein